MSRRVGLNRRFNAAGSALTAALIFPAGRGYGPQRLDAQFTSAMILVPQIVVAVMAPWIGYFSELWGRKPLLIVSFAVQIARAALLAFITNPFLLISAQMLDGISGAVRTVLTTVIVADLTTGTGRLNVTMGMVGLVAAIAASISTTAFGFGAQEVGPQAAFLGMGLIAASGALVVWFLLGETKPAKYID